MGRVPGLSQRVAQGEMRLDNGARGKYPKPTEKNMTAKAEAINAISGLPDDAPLEDIMYRLYVLDKIHQGERDIQEGRTISNDDLKKEAASR